MRKWLPTECDFAGTCRHSLSLQPAWNQWMFVPTHPQARSTVPLIAQVRISRSRRPVLKFDCTYSISIHESHSVSRQDFEMQEPSQSNTPFYSFRRLSLSLVLCRPAKILRQSISDLLTAPLESYLSVCTSQLLKRMVNYLLMIGSRSLTASLVWKGGEAGMKMHTIATKLQAVTSLA